MKNHLFVLSMVLCFVGSHAVAGSVYKCRNEQGAIVFSDTACSASAEKVQVKSENPSSSGNTGLRPGEVKALKDIRRKERQQRNRRATRSATDKSLSYADRQRLKSLQKEKASVMFDLNRRHLSYVKRDGLRTRLKSIDREITAIRKYR